MPAAEPSVPGPTEPVEATPALEVEAAAIEAADNGPEPDWKPEYEANLARWRAEADVARAKAEATRERIAKEREAEAQGAKDAEATERQRKKDAEAAKEREARLAAALADDSAPASASSSTFKPAGENKKLREAWEHISTPRGAPGPLATGGSPATATAPPSSTWEEVSAPSAPRSGDSSDAALAEKKQADKAFEEATGVPVVSAAKPASTPQPSLTLSIFTKPGSLTLSRVIAALGINLVLPFINGVFLGLGEIFAREAVRVGRLWWRGDREWATRKTTGGRGTAGVGLSAAGF